MQIQRYSSEYRFIWNDFIESSKNGHFFFNRNFMEYHENSFEDFSLMFFSEKKKLVAVLPANIKRNILYSHQGLSFGGLITNKLMKTELMLEIFEEMMKFLKQSGVIKMLYKCVPHTYHLLPADEDKYALFRNNAKLVRRDVSSTIFIRNKLNLQSQRKRAIERAKKNKLIFEESKNYKDFWEILNFNLISKFNVAPVHNLTDIVKLVNLFPKNIKLFIARKEKDIYGGAVVFENKNIAHTQYLVNTADGRKIGALDLVINELITNIYKHKLFFSLGISNENNGKILNSGLINQKEGFGASAVSHDFYELLIK